MTGLWEADDVSVWYDSLYRYDAVIAAQNVKQLVDLDQWYQRELPVMVASRAAPSVSHAELVRVTEWKMARGVWRAPNLVLVKGNAPDDVLSVSAAALAEAPHPTKPIAGLTTLAGVGPATASAVAAAYDATRYPFFDELVAAQVPQLGKVAWTMGYYARYAVALRARAARLGEQWSAAMVERALWANVGGKAGSSRSV